MTSRNHPQQARGFSLIEVLIAVVVLSLGLLALAALQMSLIRSSSGTKAQSIGMALAKQELETTASYSSMAGYVAITDKALTAVPGNPISGTNYSRQVDVTRYVYDKAPAGATRYVAVGDTLTDTQIKAIDADYLPGREFKRIVVTVQWADNAGATQRVRVEDAISAIEPADTIAASQNKNYGAPRKAISIITNPASVAGVIPIAIGNGSDTAATNPRPILLAQGNSTTLVETRFDIYTYAALNGATATAQSRVETAVIGCTCRTGTGNAASYRPTYWDGYKYTSPDTASNARLSLPKSGIDQSTLCTACCRDHQDPSGVTGPKFDPRRSPHNHYLASDLTTAINLASASSNTDYNEACRLIRVDGTFRVAPETYNDYFGLLGTAGLNQSSPTTTLANAVPGSTQQASYQTFVLNYLHQRFITASQAYFNVPLNWASVSGNSTLDNPSSAAISPTSTPQYLHARGLYIDYLTDEVRQLVYDAGQVPACKGTDGNDANSSEEFEACVFKLLPFTSINLTELASWSATNSAKVDVDNSAFKTTISSVFPVKGRADAKNGAVNGDTSTGQSQIQRTSAGLAVTSKVFPDADLNESYVPNMLTDSNNQVFTVGGVVTPPSDDVFHVLLTGATMLSVVDYNNKPSVTTTIANGACASDEVATDNTVATDQDKILTNDNNAKPDEFRCTPDAGQNLGGSVTVTVSNYNRASTVSVGNACRNSGNTDMPYSKDFDATMTQYVLVTAGVDANADGDYLDAGDTAPVYSSNSIGAGTVTNTDRPGTLANSGEYTAFIVNPLLTGARLEVGFGAQEARCPANWSTFINNSGNKTSLTNTQKSDPTYCVGNGANAAPNWNTSSWVACPNAVTFP